MWGPQISNLPSKAPEYHIHNRVFSLGASARTAMGEEGKKGEEVLRTQEIIHVQELC